jgi:transcriptional regulator with XRE-family HTH domain
MSDPAAIGPAEGERRPRPLLRTMLGDVLRRTRLEQGRTLADVAQAARVSMPYLSELERGRKEGSSEILAAICDALGIGLPDLLAEARRGLLATAQRDARARARRDLVADRARRAPVAALHATGDRPASSPGQPGDAEARLAA